MVQGTADVDSLVQAIGVPTVARWPSEPVHLTGVTVLQVVAELRRTRREALLPPGLHPTDPPALSVQAWTVEDSPWGSFSWAHTRVSCRSGARARGFTTAAVIDSAPAAAALRELFGFPCRLGDLRLARFFDRTELTVTHENAVVLGIAALDPQPLGPTDLQYTSTMNLANTPSGLRLVQVEAKHEVHTVERLTGRIHRFDSRCWGHTELDPYHLVTTTVSTSNVMIPPVRFICKPDVDAFTGTEAVQSH